MLKGGLTIIRGMLDYLKPSERRVAEYILREPKQAVNSTIAELAKHSHTSEAAIVRLCKSLEVNGFQDLKLRIAGDLQKPQAEEYMDILPSEPIERIIKKVSNNNMQAIRETVDILHLEEFEKAVNAIEKANRIHFFGVGASFIVAQDAHQKFLRINKNSMAYSDVHLASYVIANSRVGDVVLGISYSGETKEVVEILDLAKKNNASTISLTKYGKHTVAENADIRLYTSSIFESDLRNEATSSRVAQLNVIDILFISVASRMYNETIEYLDRTREAVVSHKIINQ